MLKYLNDSCTSCSITSDIIDMESFTCYPESPTYVTYRARLEGTSETDSGSLISLIEDWVRGGASINITARGGANMTGPGLILTVDSECSVRVLSFDEEGCSLPSDPPPFDLLFLIIISVGGLVAAIIIGIVLVVIIVLLTRWRKRRTSKPKM